MSEFSRRVDVRIIKDEPITAGTFRAKYFGLGGESAEVIDGHYREYLKSFQPYRFHAKAQNFEIVSVGESYHDEAGAINAIELLFGDDTTVYYAREYGEDRGDNWLRYGVTDRNAQGDDSPEQADGE